MIKKTLLAAIAMTLTATLTAGAAQADENQLSKPAGAGMHGVAG